MSELDITLIILTFILGFGITQILTGFSLVARLYPDIEINWIPLIWAFSILSEHIQFWFGLALSQDSFGETPEMFWLVLLLAICLFLSGALILPGSIDDDNRSLELDFNKRGKRALIALGCYVLGAIVFNIVEAGTWKHPWVYGNVLMFCAVVGGFITEKTWMRIGFALMYLLLMGYGFAFIYARPGAI